MLTNGNQINQVSLCIYLTKGNISFCTVCFHCVKDRIYSMKNMYCLIIAFFAFTSFSFCQEKYHYTIDLTKIKNDRLEVELLVPKLNQNTVEFTFPRIIPGTYRVADYGKFVNELKAFDNKGKSLSVSKQGTNKWKITNAGSLSKISYVLDDIFDATQDHNIYPMAATNFEEDNIILHTPGIFGFIDGHYKLPFTITVHKPARFYGATSLRPVSSTPTTDVFQTTNLNDLYESPIMYAVPDTSSIQVGNAQVLVAVYSPNKSVSSKLIAEWMSELLEASKEYLGGKLPTDKYAFLYYFKDPSLKHSFPAQLSGALEHPTSSFYYLYEAPPQQLKNSLVDISSHEFFHIITPLTIASTQVKEFNYNEVVLSKHLWLYEGSTEYTSHHVQVKHGLKTVGQFMKTLSDKITFSRTYYNDALPFTELSRGAAGKYEKEYGNVYQKGALINACLDLLLLHLSDGRYGHRNMTYDLGVRFGKERAFSDEELFDEIGRLTYPEVKDFLVRYVDGKEPIPYEKYFELAGFRLSPKVERKIFSLGGFSPGLKAGGIFFIQPNTNYNDFGKKIGYKPGDEIYAFNGVKVNQQNFGKVADSIRKSMKEGDAFTATVGRVNDKEVIDTLQLKATVFSVTETEKNKIDVLPNPTKKMELVRTAWLTTKDINVKEYHADVADVSSVDAIVKATYDVISGPPGPRNWDRFYSLFLPGAKMGSIVVAPTGETSFHSMTPAEYKKSNGPFFMQSGFFEQELGRNIMQYGSVASVESAYQFRMKPDGPAEQRGVNYFTLVKSGGRWWIANLSWQSETKELPIPSSLINKK